MSFYLCVCVCLSACVCVFLKHKAVVPSGYRNAFKRSWSLGRSGTMWDKRQNGAMEKAMDMKSRLMVVAAPSQIIPLSLNHSFCFVMIQRSDLSSFCRLPSCPSLSASGAAVPAARHHRDEGAPGGLGVAGRRPVAEHGHPHAARQRAHLLLHHQQPDGRPVRFRHPLARLLPVLRLHDHLHAARLPEQQGGCGRRLSPIWFSSTETATFPHDSLTCQGSDV